MELILKVEMTLVYVFFTIFIRPLYHSLCLIPFVKFTLELVFFGSLLSRSMKEVFQEMTIIS